MLKSLTTQSPGFVCDCYGPMRSVCSQEEYYGIHEGKSYCVLHYPCKNKKKDFKKALERKLAGRDFSFAGVWFPDEFILERFVFDHEVDFQRAVFSENVNFRRVTFQQSVKFGFSRFLSGAEFIRTHFEKGAEFTRAEFWTIPPSFLYAHFKGDAAFVHVRLSVADFRMATFNGNADFRWAAIEHADFTAATFRDYVRFSSPRSRSGVTSLQSLKMQFARVEFPERVSFHGLPLRPEWFVNVSSRKFSFTDVVWDLQRTRANKFDGVPTPESLSRTFRDLADNAEENHRYAEASKLRFMAMDAQRRSRWRGFPIWRLSWWYWLASGYGDRAWQALLVLLGVWFICGLIYSQNDFARWDTKVPDQGSVVSSSLSRALVYSAGVMTLQKPEPRPATTLAQSVVMLETIIGPIQAALLAFAIRRKFMR